MDCFYFKRSISEKEEEISEGYDMIVMGEEKLFTDCGFIVSKIILLNYYLKKI